MKLTALRCRFRDRSRTELIVEQWLGTLESLEAGRSSGASAYLVAANDADSLRQTGSHDEVVDRGRKNPAVALARLLLGHDRIPVCQSGFKQHAQVMRSVRALLAGAAAKRERNAYVIGVPADVLAAVARTAKPWDGAGATDSTGWSSLAQTPWLDAPAVPEALADVLVGGSLSMQLARQLVVINARLEEPVLILGETGTGKDVAARQIHELDARRRNEHYIVVNCAGIAEDLLESEMFGYRPGAFTGASRHGKEGLWSQAGRGTLFLDEVGDLSLRHQAKILRAIENKTVLPVGAVREVRVECRIIAATSRDLTSMIAAKEFREDLYQRLVVMPIYMPRLADHLGDIDVLAAHFWRKHAPGRAPLPPVVIAELRRYRWNGNVRELSTTLRRLNVLCPRDPLTASSIVFTFQFKDGGRPQADHPTASDDLEAHRSECLRHLRTAEQSLRTCKVLLRPLAKGPVDEATARRMRTVVTHRLAELQMLGQMPQLFHSNHVFSAVHEVAGGLVVLRGMLNDDPTGAQHHWRQPVARDIATAISAITREMERLLGESR
jgi:DNA-binding NtrC family response regulator